MGIFKKSINHSKSSKDLDKKIQKLDEEIKKNGVLVEEDKYDWRKSLYGEEQEEKVLDITEEYISEVKQKQNRIANVEESIEYSKKRETRKLFRDLYEGEVERVVEAYVSKSSEDIVSLREDLFYELGKKPEVDLSSIEEKLNSLTLKYNRLYENIQKGGSNDPLLQSPVNIEQLRNHYQLLVGRLQEKLASIGGGGEVRLQYLDDIVGIATNAAAYDGKFLKYNHSLKKFEFVTVTSTGGSGIGFADLSVTNNVAGVSTLSYNNTNGVFSYTPPDLSSYLTSNSLVGYATEGYVDSAVVGFATEGYVDNSVVGFITSGALVGYATEGYVDNAVATSGGSGAYASSAGIATYAGISGIATYTSEWTLGANGTSDYTFTGPGLTGAENDPVIYLVRGQQYKFANSMGAHPFQIQEEYQSTSGTVYNDGIVNNGVSNGILTWDVQFDAPNKLHYQCTSHVGMSGTIHILNAMVGFATEGYVDNAVVGFATEGYVDNAVVGFITSGALVGYATEGYVDSAVVGYATEGYVDSAVVGFATEGYVDNAIVGFITSGASGAGLTGLTGASEGTYGNSTNSAQISVDANGRITGISQVAISAGGGGGGISGINVYDSQGSLGVTTNIKFTDNLDAVSVGNTIEIKVTGVVTSLVGYATEGYVVTSLVGYATEGYVDSAVVGFATEGYVDNAVVGFATEGYVDNALVGYATEGYVDSAVVGFATEGYVDNAVVGFVTSGGSVAYAVSSGIATFAAFISEYIVENGSGTNFSISGPGINGSGNNNADDDPDLYFQRGQKYRITNKVSNHPFRIQSTPNGNVGTEYNVGISTNNIDQNESLTWEVALDAPDKVYYQCIFHNSMGGVIYIGDDGQSVYAASAGIATYAGTAGIATYAGTAGIATYAGTAGIATYAGTAGIATYAGTAGIATNVNGGIGTLTSLNVSGLTSTTNLNVTGIATVPSLDVVSGGNPSISSPGVLNLEAVTVAISTNLTVGDKLDVSGISTFQDDINVGTGATVAFFDISSGNVGIGSTQPTSTLDINGSLNATGIVTASEFSGPNTLKERTIVSGSTTSIVNNGIGNTDITGFKSYALMKVGLSTAGWLRIYIDSESRTNDTSRSIGQDPSAGSGVIAEFIATGVSTTQKFAPFVMGGNMDEPVSDTIYMAITNTSGVTTSITANLTILKLEA